MSFDWKDYTKLAEKLYNEVNKNSMEEAYNRSVISRAYYGVFCLSRNKAGLEFYIPRRNTNDPGVHRKVINHYKNSSKLEEKQAGKILDELRIMRNKADYDGQKKTNIKDAEGANIKTKQVLNNLGISL